MDLAELHRITRPHIVRETHEIQRELNRTAKWRFLKRYRLFEKLYELEQGLGLLDHVLLDDEIEP